MTSYRTTQGMAALIGVLSVFIFGGCTATVVRIPPEKTTNPLTSQQVVVALRLDEIGTYDRSFRYPIIAPTGGAYLTLASAVISTGANMLLTSYAEKIATPLRTSLQGYDVGINLSDSLRHQLIEVGWSKDVSVEARHMTDNATLVSWANAAPTDSLLVVDIDYRLTSEFDAIALRATTVVYPKNIKLVKKTGALPPASYYNVFFVTLPLPPSRLPGAYKARITQWAADEGKLARESLDLGISELAKMIAFDSQQPGPSDNGLYRSKEAVIREGFLPVAPDAPEGAYYKGYIIHSENNRVWIRMPGGELISDQK